MAKKEETTKSLVVESRIKELVATHGLRSSGELIDAVNKELTGLLEKAATRCKANDRSTVRPGDL